MEAQRLLRIARDALAKRAGAAEQEGAEAGFTLIELMVVLLIMAILLAIAIPTFLGVKGGAQDRAAQSNLTNALTSAKAVYSTSGTYPLGAGLGTGAGGLISTLQSQEPELSFIAPASTAAKSTNQISVEVVDGGDQLILVDQSATGTCWALSDWDGTGTVAAGAGTVGGVASTGGDAYTAWNDATSCTAAAVVAATTVTWSGTYPTAPVFTGAATGV